METKRRMERRCAVGVAVALAAGMAGRGRVLGESSPQLLLNPGAETGLSGWTPAGASNPGVGGANALGDGISPHGGGAMFVGGIGASGALTQNVALNGYAPTFEEIDAGVVQVSGTFFEQSFPQVPADTAGIVLNFFGGGGANLGSAPGPGVGSTAGWQNVGVAGPLAVGTRTISYVMNFVRNSGTDLDAFIDDNSLTVSYPGSSWKGAATGNWGSPANWVSGLPVAGQDALFTSAGSADTATFDGNYGTSSRLANLYVDSGNGTQTLNQANNTMAATAEYIGNVGSGAYHQTGGVNNVSGDLYVGYLTGSSGTYSISAGSLVAQHLWSGYQGLGNVSISGSANVSVAGEMNVSSANSAMFVSGGTLSAFSLLVSGANCNVSISGGQVTFVGGLQCSNATDRLVLSDGILTLEEFILVTPANLVWTGGTIHVTSNFTLETIGTNVAVNGGQSLMVDGTLSVGATASATASLTGGSIQAASIALGSGAGLNGTLQVQAGNSVVLATNLFVGGGSTGSAGNGLLAVSGGLAQVSALTVYAHGNVTLSGGTLALTSLVLPTPGAFAWSGGTLHFLSDLSINSTAALGNSLAVPGNGALIAGNLTNNGTLTVAGTGSASVQMLTNNFGGNINSAGVFSIMGSSGNSINFGNITVAGFTSHGAFTNVNNFSVSGPQTWFAGSSFSNFGSATFNSDAGSATSMLLSLIVNNGNVSFGATQHLNSITLNGGTLYVTAGTVKTNGLTFAGNTNNWTGNLNLGTNDLIVEASVNHGAVLAALQNEVSFGMTHAAGITSPALPPHIGLAVLDNGALASPFTTIGGESVDQNSILILPALAGDANVDGVVDLSDLSAVLNHFGATDAAWTSGNFDGAATVDLTDLSDVLNDFGQTYAGAGAASVAAPEPAGLVVLLSGLASLSRRRGVKR